MNLKLMSPAQGSQKKKDLGRCYLRKTLLQHHGHAPEN